MKIGFDAKRLFNNRTGLGNYSRTLADNLLRFFPEHAYLLFSPKLYENEFAERYKKRFKTILPKTPGSGTYWRSYGVGKDIARHGVDIFHGLSNELPFRLEGVKKVVTVHDLIFKKLPETYPFLDRQIFDLKSRKSCKSADIVIAISESTKRDIMHYYGIEEKKIRVVYQACEAVFYEENKAAEEVSTADNLPENYLLSVGSVTERKNLLQTVKALYMLPKSLRLPLVVVGSGGDYQAKVERYLRSIDAEKSVIWLENVRDTAHLKQLYKRATLSVYPSRYEGFGLPVAESLLCRTPVITSDVSSLPEAGGAGAELVNPDSADEMKTALEKLLTDTDYAADLAEKGYHYARKTFDPQRVTGQIIDIYKNLLHD